MENMGRDAVYRVGLGKKAQDLLHNQNNTNSCNLCYCSMMGSLRGQTRKAFLIPQAGMNILEIGPKSQEKAQGGTSRSKVSERSIKILDSTSRIKPCPYLSPCWVGIQVVGNPN